MPKSCEMVSKVARDAQLVFFCVSSALVSEVYSTVNEWFWCEPSQRWSSKWKGGNFTSFCLLSSAILDRWEDKKMTMRTMKISKEHYCCGCCRSCCGCCWWDVGLHPAVLVCDSDGQYGSGGSHREACGNATDAGSGVDFRWVWPFFPSWHHPLLRAMLQMKRRSIDVRMFGNLDMPHPFIDGMVEWLDLNPYCYPFFGSEFWGFATCFGQHLKAMSALQQTMKCVVCFSHSFRLCSQRLETVRDGALDQKWCMIPHPWQAVLQAAPFEARYCWGCEVSQISGCDVDGQEAPVKLDEKVCSKARKYHLLFLKLWWRMDEINLNPSKLDQIGTGKIRSWFNNESCMCRTTGALVSHPYLEGFSTNISPCPSIFRNVLLSSDFATSRACQNQATQLWSQVIMPTVIEVETCGSTASRW